MADTNEPRNETTRHQLWRAQTEANPLPAIAEELRSISHTLHNIRRELFDLLKVLQAKL